MVELGPDPCAGSAAARPAHEEPVLRLVDSTEPAASRQTTSREQNCSPSTPEAAAIDVQPNTAAATEPLAVDAPAIAAVPPAASTGAARAPQMAPQSAAPRPIVAPKRPAEKAADAASPPASLVDGTPLAFLAQHPASDEQRPADRTEESLQSQQQFQHRESLHEQPAQATAVPELQRQEEQPERAAAPSRPSPQPQRPPTPQQERDPKPAKAGTGITATVAAASRRNTPYVCQVDNCGRNLAKEKEYYRRYRVCKSHAGASSALIGGEPKRYCQQCSIFHALAEFDDAKRSCRARLSWHNNKRRKRVPQDGDGASPPVPAPAPRITRHSLAAQEGPSAQATRDEGADAADTASVAATGAPALAPKAPPEPPQSQTAAGTADSGQAPSPPPQWAAHGRRGGAGVRSATSTPPLGQPAWLAGLSGSQGVTPDMAYRLAAVAAAAAAPQPSAALPKYPYSSPQAGLMAVARGFSLSSDAACGVPTAPGADWNGTPSAAALAGAEAAAADAAIMQARLHLAARMQAAEAAAAAAAAQEAAQAAALAQLRAAPQHQRMQDPRAATSLINVVRAAFERQQAQQAREEEVAARDEVSRSSAFQPYRPTAMRPPLAVGPASSYTVKQAGIATSPPKGEGADWKTRLLQRYREPRQ